MKRLPTRRLAPLAVLVLLTTLAAAPAADWPRFRGPNGTGVAADAGIPVRFAEGDGILWRVPLPGTGNSSPVVSRGKLFVQSASADGRERSLMCLDAATGKTLWTRTVPGTTATIHKNSSLASSTPAADGERVYVLFWDGTGQTLTAFDADGGLQWKQDLGPFKSQHGAGTSPVEYDGRVYVNHDQDGAAVLLAFDARTGQPAWRAERKGYRASYSVPLVRETPAGRKELVTATTTATTGYDPATGAVLWSWSADWSYRDKGPLRVVGSPVAWKDMVLIQYGDGDGSRRLTAIKAPGEGVTPELVWEKRKGLPYVPCPLVVGDHLFAVNDAGMASCYEIATGKEVWADQRVGASYYASPVLIDGKVYAFTQKGDVTVFEANPEKFVLVAKSKVGEAVMASPAVADGRMYVRGAKHLICVGKGK
jgi:outer membrane protein assembly factor BamB